MRSLHPISFCANWPKQCEIKCCLCCCLSHIIYAYKDNCNIFFWLNICVSVIFILLTTAYADTQERSWHSFPPGGLKQILCVILQPPTQTQDKYLHNNSMSPNKRKVIQGGGSFLIVVAIIILYTAITQSKHPFNPTQTPFKRSWHWFWCYAILV